MDWEYEYNRLVNSALKLNEMYKEKSKRIDKAIEYMKQWGNEPDADMYKQMKDYNEWKYLLSILKGEDKE